MALQQIVVDEAMVRVYRVQHDFLIHIFLCCASAITLAFVVVQENVTCYPTLEH